jgi:hypothetical protein
MKKQNEIQQTNEENEEPPKGKTFFDFVMLFIALLGLIAVLLFLKYAITAFHLV